MEIISPRYGNSLMYLTQLSNLLITWCPISVVIYKYTPSIATNVIIEKSISKEKIIFGLSCIPLSKNGN